VEVKGYRIKSEAMSFSLYDCDAILDYVEGMKGEDLVAIETTGDEEVTIHFFIREDGEQLPLDMDTV
jgi:hypothetical protein